MPKTSSSANQPTSGLSSVSATTVATPAPPPPGAEPPPGISASDDDASEAEEEFTLGVDRSGAPLDFGGGSLVTRLARLKAAAAAGRVGEAQYQAELKKLLRVVAQENAVAVAAGGAQRFGCDEGHPLERNRSTSSSWRCAAPKPAAVPDAISTNPP